MAPAGRVGIEIEVTRARVVLAQDGELVDLLGFEGTVAGEPVQVRFERTVAEAWDAAVWIPWIEL